MKATEKDARDNEFMAPFGPPELEVAKPGGVFNPPWAIDPHAARPDKSWVDHVDETKVRCFSCGWAWLMLKHAPVLNVMPDGKPLMEREGYCLYPAQMPGGAPLPLEDRYVLRCNQYRRSENWQATEWTKKQEETPLLDPADFDLWAQQNKADVFEVLRDSPVMTAQGRAIGGFLQRAVALSYDGIQQQWGGGLFTIRALGDAGQLAAACQIAIMAMPKAYRNPQTRCVEQISEDDHVG
jgi:hypothetical protein